MTLPHQKRQKKTSKLGSIGSRAGSNDKGKMTSLFNIINIKPNSITKLLRIVDNKWKHFYNSNPNDFFSLMKNKIITFEDYIELSKLYKHARINKNRRVDAYNTLTVDEYEHWNVDEILCKFKRLTTNTTPRIPSYISTENTQIDSSSISDCHNCGNPPTSLPNVALRLGLSPANVTRNFRNIHI